MVAGPLLLASLLVGIVIKLVSISDANHRTHTHIRPEASDHRFDLGRIRLVDGTATLDLCGCSVLLVAHVSAMTIPYAKRGGGRVRHA